MKRSKFKQYNIDDPMYRANLTLLIGDLIQIKDYLLTEHNISPDVVEDIEQVDGKYIAYGKYKIIILKNTNIITMVHEVIHYVLDSIHSKGIPIRIENDEVITYYVDMTLKNMLKVIKNK